MCVGRCRRPICVPVLGEGEVGVLLPVGLPHLVWKGGEAEHCEIAEWAKTKNVVQTHWTASYISLWGALDH